jgi:hypothetical protein
VPSAEEKTIDKEKLAAMVPPVTEETPAFKNIYINNITCKGAGRAVLLQGLPEMNLKNIKLNNIRIEAIKGIDVIDADGIEMKNVFVSAEQGPILKMKNTKNSSFEKFSYQSKDGVNVTGELTSSLSFKKSDFSNASQQITISPEVKKGSVKVE